MSVAVGRVEEQASSSSETEAKELKGKAVLGDKGRLVIPAALREALGLQPGDTLDLHIADHELRISSRFGRMRRAQERARKFFGPGRILSDELTAERRAAAMLE